MKRGFTLIEIVIAMGIFGVIAVIGTNLVIDVIRNVSEMSIKNEVRQNGSFILQDMVRAIRQSKCVKKSSDIDNNITLSTYSTDDCTGNADVAYDVFVSLGSDWGVVTKTVGGTVSTLTSDVVSVCDNQGICDTASCAANGLVVEMDSPVQTNNTVKLTLVVQQEPAENLRSNLCSRIVLTDSATPRQY